MGECRRIQTEIRDSANKTFSCLDSLHRLGLRKLACSAYKSENHDVSMLCSQLGGGTEIWRLESWGGMEFHEPIREAI